MTLDGSSPQTVRPAPTAVQLALGSLPFLVAAACSFVAFHWIPEHGLSISRDGAHYLQVAFDVHFDGPRIGNPGYPVGYSTLIALAMFFEHFPVNAAAWVGAVSFGVVLFVSADLYRRASGSPLVAALAVLALASLPAFWSSFLHVLSEPAFCALVVLHAWCVVRHAERRDAGSGWLLAAALVLGLAGVVRTIAYAVLVVFALYVAWCAFERRRDARALLHIGLAFVLSWLPVASVALVRQARGIKVHGSRTQSSEPLALNIERAATTFPADLGLFAMLGLAAFVGLLVWRTWRTPLPTAFSDAERGSRWIALYAFALVGVYVAAIIAAATLTRISPVGTRFFAPYYPLVFALVCCTASLAPRVVRVGAVAALCIGFLTMVPAQLRALEGLGREAAALESNTFVLHHQLGFDRNPATAELRQFLRELAAQPEPVNVSAVAPLPKGGQHQAAARTLFFRASTIDQDGDARFERFATGQFMLRTAETPAGAGLRYRDLPLLAWHDASGPTIHLALSREMGGPGRRERWLIAPAFADPMIGVGPVPGSPLEVVSSREVGAYRIHRFVWTAEPRP